MDPYRIKGACVLMAFGSCHAQQVKSVTPASYEYALDVSAVTAGDFINSQSFRIESDSGLTRAACDSNPDMGQSHFDEAAKVTLSNAGCFRAQRAPISAT